LQVHPKNYKLQYNHCTHFIIFFIAPDKEWMANDILKMYDERKIGLEKEMTTCGQLVAQAFDR